MAVVYIILKLREVHIMNPIYHNQEPENVDISVELDRKGLSSSEYDLNVAVTNKSAEPITIYRHSLPWVGWNSILLVAVKTNVLGTVLEKRPLIDDPGPERVTIKPGEMLAGQILLTNRFPDLLKALKERDVIVFWSYQLQPIDTPPLQRISGHVLLSKFAG